MRRLLSAGRARVLGSAVLLLPLAAAAHHSAAMFDATRPLVLDGVVRQFQWTSPHCYIQLLVSPGSANGNGGRAGGPVPRTAGAAAAQAPAVVEWSLEMGAPMYLYRLGWRPSTVKPGDKLSVRINPLRDGSHGGLLVQATTADGRKLGNPVSP